MLIINVKNVDSGEIIINKYKYSHGSCIRNLLMLTTAKGTK